MPFFMNHLSISFDDFLQSIEPSRSPALQALRATLQPVLEQLGFQEIITAQNLQYVVPYSLYPQGYHCEPPQPLPFITIASQKNYIALYHLGMYASPTLTEWFATNYPLHSSHKLDMGKSCIRFKKPDQIPYTVLKLLAEKVDAVTWIQIYEQAFRKPK
jgi:hypothetical protein